MLKWWKASKRIFDASKLSSLKIVIDEDISNLFCLITFMWIGLRRSEMFTGVTAPQKRKHTQKDKKIDIRLDCAYTSTSLVGLFFTLFNQTFDNLMASPLMEFSAAHLKRFCCDAELKGLRFDSSRKLGFFLCYSSWQHQYFILSIWFYDLICYMMVRD